MELIQSVEISKLGFVPQKLGDLLEHEGPLLSLYIDRDNPENYFLYKWVDNDEKCNRWAILPCTSKDLLAFFEGGKHLRELFLNKPFCFVIDLDEHLQIQSIQIIATEALPEAFLPSEKSFFQEEAFSVFATSYHNLLKQKASDPIGNVLKELSELKASQAETTRVLNDLIKLQASH